MSTFSTYNTIIEQKIANNSEVFYETQMKRQAANDVIKEIVQEYDLPEMQKVATIAFASGVGSKPADFGRMAKLWNATTDIEFVYVVPDVFDRLDDTAGNYWTEDYNVAASARRLLIKPTSVTSLTARYHTAPTEMTDDSTESGLSSEWDEVVAYGTAAKLLQISNRYDEAREYERLYRKRCVDVYLAVKNPGGIKQNNRLKSKYERISQLGVNSITAINI